MDKSPKIEQCFSLQDENIQLLVSPNPGLKFYAGHLGGSGLRISVCWR